MKKLIEVNKESYLVCDESPINLNDYVYIPSINDIGIIRVGNEFEGVSILKVLMSTDDSLGLSLFKLNEYKVVHVNGYTYIISINAKTSNSIIDIINGYSRQESFKIIASNNISFDDLPFLPVDFGLKNRLYYIDRVEVACDMDNAPIIDKDYNTLVGVKVIKHLFTKEEVINIIEHIGSVDLNLYF